MLFPEKKSSGARAMFAGNGPHTTVDSPLNNC
jgi:hypothetical protein